jgi:hypothetical protein
VSEADGLADIKEDGSDGKAISIQKNNGETGKKMTPNAGRPGGRCSCRGGWRDRLKSEKPGRGRPKGKTNNETETRMGQ